jgi:hypothetical protein
MDIKQALILCKDQKTDDELKAIMATHPWSGAIMHGFYKSLDEKWEPDLEYWHGTPDAIWVDGGITGPVGVKWIVENYHVPNLFYCRPLPDDPFGPYGRRKDELEQAWWKANVALIFHQIPDEYHAYRVYYGEIEDDYDHDGSHGGHAAVAEEAWRECLLHHFNYSPEVKAALGITEAAR